MMGEIKFRAWNTKTNQWVTDMLRLHPNGSIMTPLFVRTMQYTGLKDKNGKEIYEGDILRHEYLLSPEMSFDLIKQSEEFVVEIPDFFYRHGDYREHQPSNEAKEPAEYMEVIGNIYENPEVLKNG